MEQALTLTEKLKKKTVAGMLTRTAAHYPNSGHTADTLSVVAEDWYETFKDILTDTAFIAAVGNARRSSRFFPTEADIFAVAEEDIMPECDKCSYNTEGRNCANLSKPGFNRAKCTSFREGRVWYNNDGTVRQPKARF